jgi:cytochrome P450
MAPTATDTKTLDDLDIHSLDLYVRDGYPWEAWDRLRAEAPVYYYDRPGIAPFWALTRYADVRAVGSDNTRFINGGPRLRLAGIDHDEKLVAARHKRAERHGWDPVEPDDMVYLDAPRHTAMRMLVARSFTPAKCRRMAAELAELSVRFVEEFEAALADAGPGGTVDLVEGLTVKQPLATICSMMGVPVDRWSDIHRWTDSLFDSESLAWALPGETKRDMRRRLRIEFFAFLDDLIDEKRATPGDDLTSLLVHADIDGEKLTQQQLHGYLMLLIAAGNETTRNATTRGILALLEHPDQLAVLEAGDESVVESTVEEVVRWTSPVIQFARTATVDVDLHGTTIRAGETVGLWYPSANRDERVFRDPYRFDVRRDPNDHVGFGHGPHFCLGANLARWELRAVFRELARRRTISKLALAGPAEWFTDLHVGAISHQPVTLAG